MTGRQSITLDVAISEVVRPAFRRALSYRKRKAAKSHCLKANRN